MKRSYDIAEVGAVASELIGALELKKGGRELVLSGELGAGKTTLVRALVEKLGVAAQVSSPSYVLCNEYESESLTIEHWDLYRCSALPEELEEPVASAVIRVIEWGEGFKALLERVDAHLSLDFAEQEDERVLALRMK